VVETTRAAGNGPGIPGKPGVLGAGPAVQENGLVVKHVTHCDGLVHRSAEGSVGSEHQKVTNLVTKECIEDILTRAVGAFFC